MPLNADSGFDVSTFEMEFQASRMETLQFAVSASKMKGRII